MVFHARPRATVEIAERVPNNNNNNNKHAHAWMHACHACMHVGRQAGRQAGHAYVTFSAVQKPRMSFHLPYQSSVCQLCVATFNLAYAVSILLPFFHKTIF